MNKKEFIKAMEQDIIGKTFFGDHGLFVKVLNKHGIPFEWMEAHIAGSYEVQTYACTDWNAEAPIYTGADIDDMPVINHEFDFINDLIVITVDC